MLATIITPRFGDTDMLGHINNVALPRWFEAAREPVFRIFLEDLASATRANWPLVLVHMDFDFHAELTFGREVEIRTRVLKIGITSLTLLHEAWQDARLRASGTVVMVHYDLATAKKIPIPAALVGQLEAHLA